MCGFVGLCKRKILNDKDINTINNISKKLNHRGPNQNSDWISSSRKVFLSHRRLSINDLSEEGIQPMISQTGRYVIVFNGEIYNFLNLKKEFEENNYKFKGRSDTEVLLCLIEKYGLKDAVSKLNGMYSFALYDLNLKKIYLVRDKTGQKPLYFYKDKNSFFFTSELRNLNQLGIKLKISTNSLSYFFQLSYIPAPLTIFENIFKLEKGIISELDLDKFQLKNHDINQKINDYDIKFKSIDFKLKKFDEVFSQVTTDHLISDVSNGTLLSGGIDSTIITYYANKVSKNKINSYCVKSIDDNFDESRYAEKIARKIGTDHTTLDFSRSEFFDELKNIHKVYDEPFGDSSQVPTYLLFKSVKNNIKVALSGDGGDEIFLGYNRYLYLNNYYNKIKFLNKNVRKIIRTFLDSFSEEQINKISNIFNLKYFNLGNKISKVSSSLNFETLEDFYYQIIRQDCNFENIVKNTNFLKSNFFKNIIFEKNLTNLENFQKKDLDTYLSDDIFVKVDRASMFNSVESRAPFVDNRVTDFAKQLDISDKINNKKTKIFLRKILNKNFHQTDFERPKMGFGNPIGKFLNFELKDWVNDLIYNNNHKVEKYINMNLITEIWELHQKKKKDYSTIIWNFIMFKNWLLENEIN